MLSKIKYLYAAAILLCSAYTNAVALDPKVFSVSDSIANCGGSSHGLWTNQDFGGACGNYFSIDGTLSIYDHGSSDSWYATLAAKAVNPQGVEAEISLLFNDWVSDYNYKQEGGLPYDTNNVDFFTSVSGNILIDSIAYDIDGFAGPNGGYGFQYGLGANAKSKTAYGASAWIQSCTDQSKNGECMSSHHWDLNLDLTPVPLPAAAWLFLSGLAGLAGFRMRKKSS